MDLGRSSLLLLMLAGAAALPAQTGTGPEAAFRRLAQTNIEARHRDWPQPVSEAGFTAALKPLEDERAALAAIPRAKLPAALQTHYDILRDALDYTLLERRLAQRAFFISGNIYNDAVAAAEPFTAKRPFADAAAARDYLAHLRTMPAVLQSYETVAEDRRAHGIVMMRGLYPQIARTLRAYGAGAPCPGGKGDNPFAAAFAARLPAGLPDDQRAALIEEAKAILVDNVCPAYAGFAGRVAALEPQGRTDGYWAMAGGRDDYRDVVELSLGERVDPKIVFDTGMAEAARLKAETLAEAAKLGFAGEMGTLPAWLSAQPGQSLPATDAGRAAYQALALSLLDGMRPLLKADFVTLPTGKVEIRAPDRDARTAPPTSAGGGGESLGSAFYTGGSADGSEPAVVHLGFPGGDHLPVWPLPTLIYHEGIPGHHLQIDTERQLIPERMNVPPVYSAFHEGWALYAEQLAGEMGGFHDPYARIGWLHSDLERAVRLVVDTGVNFEGWSAERADAYQQEMLGVHAGTGRFFSWPGQGLGYYWGYLHFLRLRAHARQALGARFDIRGFHQALLRNGIVPFGIVDASVEQWIAERRK